MKKRKQSKWLVDCRVNSIATTIRGKKILLEKIKLPV
jgi:hypothetical protein